MSEESRDAARSPCAIGAGSAADASRPSQNSQRNRRTVMGSQFLPEGGGADDGESGVSPISHAAAAELDRAAGLDTIEPPSAPQPVVSGLSPFDETEEGQHEIEIHGTAVALEGRAALFVGRPASGKSALALSMLPLGARLVADDRVCLTATDTDIRVAPRAGFEGLIEARGIGFLRVDAVSDARLAVVVDMDRTELHRLPPARTHKILTKDVHLVYGRENWSLGPALVALLTGALVAPEDL